MLSQWKKDLENYDLVMQTFNKYRAININESMNFFNLVNKLREIQESSDHF